MLYADLMLITRRLPSSVENLAHRAAHYTHDGQVTTHVCVGACVNSSPGQGRQGLAALIAVAMTPQPRCHTRLEG